jgi:hypothetical protein
MLDTISTQMMNSTHGPTVDGQETNRGGGVGGKTSAFISSLTIMENQFLQITSELLQQEYKKQHEGIGEVNDSDLKN